MAEGSSGSSSSPGADAGIKSRGVSDSDAGPSAEALEALGLKGDAAVGGRVGGSRKGTGPGAGRGVPEPLHCTGTPPMLQARGRPSARVLFMGSWKGTFAVIIRQAQSMLPLMSDFTAPQQP